MKRARAYQTAVILAALAIAAGGPATAGAKGRRNTAAVLGALAVYEAIQGRGGNAVVLGAGAVGAYERYREARDRQEYGYRGRYRRTHRRYPGDRYRLNDYERRGRHEGGRRVRHHDEVYYLER